MENTITMGSAAELLGVTIKTLQCWEREGRLITAGRTESNRRRHTEAQLRIYQDKPRRLKCRRGSKKSAVAATSFTKPRSKTMLLAHRIRLDPTAAQSGYFAQAAGTARRLWNWALAEWLRQRDAGGKPNAMALKKQFNAIKYAHPDWLDEDGLPWLRTMHRDSHAQPFTHLARAWSRYFDQRKAGVPAYPPRFK